MRRVLTRITMKIKITVVMIMVGSAWLIMRIGR